MFSSAEDELSGVSSALWLCADSAALRCHLLSFMHLLFESKGMWSLYLEHVFGKNRLRSAEGLHCFLDSRSGFATPACDVTAGVMSTQG